MTDVFLGIDVGTGSVRAGIFDASGRRFGTASRDIRIWRPRPDFVEQSSDDVWQAVCGASRAALAQAGMDVIVRGIGFDATCSLVVLDAAGRPVTVSPSGDDAQNIIVWMDHRAIPEADHINASGHPVLRYVGGRISPEMETPKLLWLKTHMPQSWARIAHAFDLPDFLTWRATGALSRSLCSTVCKWTYLGHEGRWDDSYFRAVGLGDLANEGFVRIGTQVLPMGTPVGRGLGDQAAAELGLAPGIAVGTSIIDAHAGGLGAIGVSFDGKAPDSEAMERRLALIGGTSSCHMAVSREPSFVPGVWGPYHSAMIPGLWLSEGGQSATGALIDHVVFSHAQGQAMRAEAEAGGRTVYEALNDRLAALATAEGVAHPGALTADLHVEPDFHGNRSPRADSTLRGIVAGLSLSDTADDLARLYLATVQAIAYGTRHIIEAMNAHGYRIDTLFACGGGTKNLVFLREHADATGCRVVLPEESEAVLLGAAILGAAAARAYPDVPAAMAAMTRPGRVIEPVGGAVAAYHQAKYRVFHRMHADLVAYRTEMAKGVG